MTISKILQAAASGSTKSYAFMDAITVSGYVSNGTTTATYVIVTPDGFGYGNTSGIFNGTTTTSAVRLAVISTVTSVFNTGTYDLKTDKLVNKTYGGDWYAFNGSAWQYGTGNSQIPAGVDMFQGRDNDTYLVNWSSGNILKASSLTGGDYVSASDWVAEQSMSGYINGTAILEDGTIVVARGYNTTPIVNIYYKPQGTGSSWSSTTISGSNGSVFGWCMGDGTNVYVCDYNNNIFKSTNGGANWSSVGAAPTGFVRSDYFIKRNGVLSYDHINGQFISHTGGVARYTTDFTSSTTMSGFTGYSGTTVVRLFALSTGYYVLINYKYGSSSNYQIYATIYNSAGTKVDEITFNPGSGYYPLSGGFVADYLLAKDYNAYQPYQ